MGYNYGVVDVEGKKLNSEQLEAIEFGDGPLLIIAGAGTGKTTVVTERIKFLVASGKASPSEILALTFTDKAAREMEERVDRAMPYGYTQMWLSTFHAFCDRLLRAEALHIGLDPRYKLLTQAETIQFLRKNLFKFNLKYFRPLGNPTKFIDGMLQHFSRLKDEDVLPEEYLNWAKGQNSKGKAQSEEEKIEAQKALELAEAYQAYEEIKIKEGFMDFGDLIANALKLLRTRKNILKQYQDQFRYVLVDEFQDTNYAQNELAMLLAGPRANIIVAGDDDQSIYRFRGAAVSNIIQFREHYPKAKIVVLIKNYRSTQEILDRSYQLVQNNNPDRLEVKEKINKKLVGMRKIDGEKIGFLYTDRVENEAEAVAKTIEQLVVIDKKYQFKDVAILIRANSQADAFIRALARVGIPYQFLGPGMLLRQPEIKDLIAYLKVLNNFEDSVSMYRILAMEFFEIPPRDLAAISNFSKKSNLSLFEIMEQIDKVFVGPETKQKINKLKGMIHRHLKLIPKETAGQILYNFLEDSGLLKKFMDYKVPIDERRAQNISKFFDKLKTYEVQNEDASVFAVNDWIDLSLDLGESPLAANMDWTEINAVNILTCHSAKGLEFPVVFLVNLVAQRFPTTERREQIPIPEALIKEILPVGDFHLEEERRLFYVGMTRAKDRLFLTAANYYGEGKRERKISPFVVETLGLEAVKKPKTEGTETQLPLLEWKKPREVEPIVLPSRPVDFLSYSQIDLFNTCPLQYRYRVIQKIPVPASAAQSFGESMHKALFAFYKAAKAGENPTKEDLVNLLDQNWLPFGYSSKVHESKTKKAGEIMLAKFYQQAYTPNKLPLDLEQLFRLSVSKNLKVVGKIDRVDEMPNNQVEIIDYKTGKSTSQKDIDKNLQLTIYALAMTDKGIYGKKPDDVVLSLYFLETQEKVSTKRTAKQLEEAKQLLIEKAKEIGQSNFEPTPGALCDFCDYKLICDGWH